MRQRIVIVLAGLVVVAAVVVFVWLRSFGGQMATPPEGHIDFSQVRDPLWPAPSFDLIDSEGGSVATTDLGGKVWVVSFIFTRCPGPCPLITKRMAELHKATRSMDDFRLVSITVDPRFDTSDVLNAYAQQWKADSKRWHFLTGEPDVVNSVVRDFKIASYQQPTAEDMDPDGIPDITHGTNMLLVDRDGQVRAVLSSEDPDFLKTALDGIAALRTP